MRIWNEYMVHSIACTSRIIFLGMADYVIDYYHRVALTVTGLTMKKPKTEEKFKDKKNRLFTLHFH